MMKKFKVGEIIESERTTVNEKSTPDWATETSNKEDERYKIESLIRLHECETFSFPYFVALIASGCYR